MFNGLKCRTCYADGMGPERGARPGALFRNGEGNIVLRSVCILARVVADGESVWGMI